MYGFISGAGQTGISLVDLGERISLTEIDQVVVSWKLENRVALVVGCDQNILIMEFNSRGRFLDMAATHRRPAGPGRRGHHRRDR